MGSGQSARKLTISNEDEANVIKISDSVVQRLTSQNDSTETKAVFVPPKANAAKAEEVQMSSSAKDTDKAFSFYQNSPLPGSAPLPYYPQYTISALQMQQEKEKELSKQDRYWEERLNKLKKDHERIDQVLAEEYQKTYDTYMADQPKNATPVITGPICTENTSKIIKCYQENPKETLRCADLVTEFSNCVDKQRSTIIDARC